MNRRKRKERDVDKRRKGWNGMEGKVKEGERRKVKIREEKEIV